MATKTTSRSPVIYLPHGGGPLPLLGDPEHESLAGFLRQITAAVERPQAIVVVSAHWETVAPTVTSGQLPALIYDYYGFPPAAYEIEYPAPGQPALAVRIRDQLVAAGFDAALDDEQGFDHGLFVPLKLMYPDATVPCLQLSLLQGLDPESHIALGRALEPLSNDGVMVVGSGLSFHNLEAFFAAGGGRQIDESAAFDDWLNETCSSSALSTAEREHRLNGWEQAPHARYCHPREEHLLPLHVCFGAAGPNAGPAQAIYNATLYGKRISGFLWQAGSETGTQ